MTVAKHRVFAMEFAKICPLYVQKAERTNRSGAKRCLDPGAP